MNNPSANVLSTLLFTKLLTCLRTESPLFNFDWNMAICSSHSNVLWTWCQFFNYYCWSLYWYPINSYLVVIFAGHSRYKEQKQCLCWVCNQLISSKMFKDLLDHSVSKQGVGQTWALALRRAVSWQRNMCRSLDIDLPNPSICIDFAQALKPFCPMLLRFVGPRV